MKNLERFQAEEKSSRNELQKKISWNIDLEKRYLGKQLEKF